MTESPVSASSSPHFISDTLKSFVKGMALRLDGRLSIDIEPDIDRTLLFKEMVALLSDALRFGLPGRKRLSPIY